MVNNGVKLWNKAKKIIPGGNQLLSKRSDQFLPDQWPSYYRKAKGINVWDMDNNRYVDMSIMGIGACTLGYADEDVNEAVEDAIENGSMCTLNCYEEVELAEKLLKIEKWGGMVRYARTGGESTSIAIRIARAATNKDKIAFCGYHGWQDWYLSSNLTSNENLTDHLLPGLNPLGVPKCLENTALPFNYNNINDLEEIITKEDDIGAIIMEPVRNFDPDSSFLKKVRKIADEIGAVLIFDEITSGWRLRVGGAHSIYGVDPDIIIFGKAMGNGHPIGAILGKEEIMETAQETFISSTFWTERVGFAAGLATINKMEITDNPKHLISAGKQITRGWESIADEHDLSLQTMGIPPLTTFQFDDDNSLKMQTLFNQEMLYRGYLASNHVYTCSHHTDQVIDEYLEAVADVFKIVACAQEQDKYNDLLHGPVISKGFKRLN